MEYGALEKERLPISERDVSVVIPLFNEMDNIMPLYAALRPVDDWMRLDLEYIGKWSLALDLASLLKTIPAVLKAPGAY